MMNTAKRAMEVKKTQRSTSAAPSRSKLGLVELVPKAPTTQQSFRSIGPVTRSLAAAARSAFSSATRQNSALRKVNKLPVDASIDKCSTPVVRLNAVNRPPIVARVLTSNRQPVLTIRQSRPLQSQSFSQNLKPEKTAVKTNKRYNCKSNVNTNEIAVSKDSVFSDEVDSEINWVIGSKYEFSTGEASKLEKKKEPSYLQISKVLNGYSSRRSITPDPKMSTTQSENCVAKSNSGVLSCCTPVQNSPLATKLLSNGFNQVTSQSSSEVSDNGFCEGRSELEDCASYSFYIPQFSQNLIDGLAYRMLVNDVFGLLTSHLKKCDILLENQKLLPDSVSEIVRVVVGRTQLLMKKRLTQFNLQLERHLKPVEGEKITTLNDLHGLWSLVDIQIDDIRQCFEQIEKSKLAGWKAVSEPKQAITTAISMPSLRMIAKPAAAISQKNLTDETATARKIAMEEKRKEETRRRQEFIRAKRQAMSQLNNNLGNKTENGGKSVVIGEQEAQIQT